METSTIALILALLYLIVAVLYWLNTNKDGGDIIEALFWIVVIFFED